MMHSPSVLETATGDDDPITALIRSLEREGQPSLAWVMRWSDGQRDPVHAAWAVSRDPWAMVQLLMRTGRDWPLGRYSLVDTAGLRRRSGVREGTESIVLGEGDSTTFLERDEHGAAEIRRRVTAPPGLDTLLKHRNRWRR